MPSLQPTLSPPNAVARWLIPLLCGLVGLVVFLPQCAFPFVYDDVYVISQNPVVSGGPWLECVTSPYWPRDVNTDPLYRPVTTLSLRLNHALFGDWAGGYRATNAVLHAICSGLVALLAMRLWTGWCVAAGLMAGLLFAAHPVHSEAVALVVGRAEVLAALFTVWLLVRHVGYLRGDRQTSTCYHLVNSVILLLAVGSKEHAVFAVPAIVCLDITRRLPGGGRESWREGLDRLAKSHYLGMVLVLALFLFARWCIFGRHTTLPEDHINRMANPLVAAPLITQLTVPAALLSRTLQLLAVPVGLCPIWSSGGIDLPDTWLRADVLTGAVLVVSGIAWALVGMRRRQVAALPCSLLVLFLILPCHFIPAANWLFAERWLYLPSVFAMVLVAGLGRFRPAMVAAIVASVVLFAATWHYQKSWSSNLRLFETVVTRHPHSYHGLIGLAHELRDREGILATEPYVARLVERFPQSKRTWFYQALLMDRQGRPQDAWSAIEAYARITPGQLPKDLEDVRRRARRALQQSVPEPSD